MTPTGGFTPGVPNTLQDAPYPPSKVPGATEKSPVHEQGDFTREVTLSHTCYGLTASLNKGLGILKYFVEDLTYTPVKEKTHQ